MMEIPLGNGKGVALVDDTDHAYLSRYKYCSDGQGYARRNVRVNGKWTSAKMHRDIMEAMKGDIVDHIDGNKLNNQRSNLRIVTHQQNMMNQTAVRESSLSRYRGVSKQKNQWQAGIKCHGVSRYLGVFTTEVAAALAYNEKAVELFGEFARLNIIQEAI